MTGSRSTFALTALAMVAFAANSLLCRAALSQTTIDAATFTAVRLGTGALCLGALGLTRRGARSTSGGSFAGATLLFLYAAAFSFAYLRLSTGVGALILFGAVQLTWSAWASLEGNA